MRKSRVSQRKNQQIYNKNQDVPKKAETNNVLVMLIYFQAQKSRIWSNKTRSIQLDKKMGTNEQNPVKQKQKLS